MHQPIPEYGESAARYLRGNIAIGVSLEDSRIKVEGKLPKPNSAIYRSRITPFQQHRPQEGGYHIELNLTLEDLARLAAPAEASLSDVDIQRLGQFLLHKLANPSDKDFYERRIQGLLRDGGIEVIPFSGSLPRGATEERRVPYVCIQFKAENLEPDPQQRTSQIAHAIRRLNEVFEFVSRKGLELFSIQENYRNELAKEWSKLTSPSDEFPSFQDKIKEALGFKFARESLTFDNLPRIVEERGSTHLRLSFNKSLAAPMVADIAEELRNQLSALSKFIQDQLGDDFPMTSEIAEVTICADPKREQPSYAHFVLNTPVTGIDPEQELWLKDTLYDDFIEILRPFEEHFVMDYE